MGKREEGWDLAGLRSTNQKARIFKGDQWQRSSRGNQLIARADYLLSLRETVNFFVPALLLYTTTLVTFPDSLTSALTPTHFGLSSLSTP